MRILFTSHEPLEAPGSGRLVESWARNLAAAGHQVRVLTIEGEPHDDAESHVRRVLCHPTDRRAPLPFKRPTLSRNDDSALRFSAMNDRQLAQYRDVLRIELDRELDLYDPCIVHVQHVWLFGHLALEAGVPYVISAHGDEFDMGQDDWRFRRYMQETAENACRILTHGDRAQTGVAALVGDLEGRVLAQPTDGSGVRIWETLPALYRAALLERFGKLPEQCER